MAKTNAVLRPEREFTHEGASAARIGPLDQLRRSVSSCLLWEDEFYEDGESIADRILGLVGKCDAASVATLAVQARQQFHLRHVPLLLVVALCKAAPGTSLVSDTIPLVVRRADELAELLALYQKVNGKDASLSAQLKKGLAKAFNNFDEYRFAKYDREGQVRLHDVMFLTHPKPGEGRAELFKRIASRTLKTPDTWEVALSGGADKKGTFERLIREGALGYLALLRNLRNMESAGCDRDLVEAAILARKGAHNVLPFRYVAAARAAPSFEPALDKALVEAISASEPLPGRTAVLVDVSGSMDGKLSSRSDLKRIDAAAALASVIAGNIRMFSFSEKVVEVPARRGMAGIDALASSQHHGGTYLCDAVATLNSYVTYDRLIVITDEQTAGRASYLTVRGKLEKMPDPCGMGYLINVASAKNGVAYGPQWKHIDGFSEHVIRWIRETEAAASV